ncbi:MAG: hypothetical protein R3B91_19830 [Planctomycetaceae bacterium]
MARAIVSASIMPAKAAADALHVAAAAVAGVQYLLTLNCKHIANAHELPRVYRLLEDHGFGQLLICTPSEFLGGDNDDDKIRSLMNSMPSANAYSRTLAEHDALVDRLQAEERKSDRPRFKSRRTKRCTGAAKSGESEVENLSSPPGDL